MGTDNKFTVDGLIDDEFNPDFEEFEGDYLTSYPCEFLDEEDQESDDEDVQYAAETQDEGFLGDFDQDELDF